jgi:hypothetical protein
MVSRFLKYKEEQIQDDSHLCSHTSMVNTLKAPKEVLSEEIAISGFLIL